MTLRKTKTMKITYEEHLDKENISLLVIFALFFLACLLIVNIDSRIDSKGANAIISVLNVVLISALIFMVIFIGVNYFNFLVRKTPLDQVISKYDDFSYDYGHRIKNFYVDNNKMDVYNYKKLNTMPKNIAPYFVEEKIQSCK